MPFKRDAARCAGGHPVGLLRCKRSLLSAGERGTSVIVGSMTREMHGEQAGTRTRDGIVSNYSWGDEDDTYEME